MEQLLTNIRPYLEALYFLSGLVVALAALLALKQIRLLKLDIIGRGERAAKEKAIEAAFEYAKAIEELTENYSEEDDDEIQKDYEGPIGDFSAGSISKGLLNTARTRFESHYWVNPVNRLDGIAASLVTGVADEKTAFEIFGWGYCGSIAKEYDVICLEREASGGRSLSHLIALYEIWSSRLSKVELENARRRLDEQLNRIPSKEISPLSPLK